MLKIGDVVKSDRLEMVGEIQDIGTCSHCEMFNLTLDPIDGPVQFYFHADEFVLVKNNEA